MDALKDCEQLFPKEAILDFGIAHHLRSAKRSNAVYCVAIPDDAKLWRAEIEKTLAALQPQERWWTGLGVGSSSAAIFAVFCDGRWKFEAQEFSRGAVPGDSADFDQCRKLLETFPGWRRDLAKVADAYPSTKWPLLVAKWGELETASSREALDAALRQLC